MLVAVGIAWPNHLAEVVRCNCCLVVCDCDHRASPYEASGRTVVALDVHGWKYRFNVKKTPIPHQTEKHCWYRPLHKAVCCLLFREPLCGKKNATRYTVITRSAESYFKSSTHFAIYSKKYSTLSVLPSVSYPKTGSAGGVSQHTPFSVRGVSQTLTLPRMKKYGVKNNTSRINKLIPHSYHINYR